MLNCLGLNIDFTKMLCQFDTLSVDKFANLNIEMHEKKSLIGLSRDEISHNLLEAGIPDQQISMRTNQIWYWLYVRGVHTFESMSNISLELRGILTKRFSLALPKIVTVQHSNDGTHKWLLRFPPRGTGRSVEVETVYIPDKRRGTLCISSQVGCTLTCSFCHTGTQRLVRNLTAGEILQQILVARSSLQDFLIKEEKNYLQNRQVISNVVVMGMGEPLYNFEAVKKALLIATDSKGLSLSKRKITISTSGVVPEIYRIGKEIGVMLAVSLHATNDALRDILVPINKKYPLSALMQTCRNYPGLSNSRRITFEYVMLRDINDTHEDARKLIYLLNGIPAKINLIPFNSWPGTEYQCSYPERIEQFSHIINKAGYISSVRTPRGSDILAACGQLKSQSKRLKKIEKEKIEIA